MNTQALQKTETQTAVVPADVSAGALQSALAGDLKRLTPDERLKFYGALCDFTGLNPLSKPFDWLELQGKLVLYANKGCAEQLRKIHGVSLQLVERKVEYGVLTIHLKGVDKTGRFDEAIGAVPFNEKNPAEAANAAMKCWTKAARRLTLSICGLGLLDESEVETIPAARAASDITNAETAEDRANKLNASLTHREKATAVEAEIVPETAKPKGGEENAEARINGATGAELLSPQPPAPEPEQDPFAAPVDPPATPPPVLDEAQKRAVELQTVFAENKDSIPYLITHGKLAKGADIATIEKTYAEKILKHSKQFLAAVEVWVKGGRK